MEFPQPDVYENFKTWGRQLISKLREIPIEHKIDEAARSVAAEGLFASGWADWHPFYKSYYWMDAHGYVHLTGVVTKPGAAGIPQTMFTLPDEYKFSGIAGRFYVPPLTVVQIYGINVQYISGSSTTIFLEGVCSSSLTVSSSTRRGATGPR